MSAVGAPRAAEPLDPPIGAQAIGVEVLTVPARRVYIATTGNLGVVMLDGSAVTWTGLLAGTVYEMCIKEITAVAGGLTGLVLW